jgi:hypothetical protein
VKHTLRNAKNLPMYIAARVSREVRRNISFYWATRRGEILLKVDTSSLFFLTRRHRFFLLLATLK